MQIANEGLKMLPLACSSPAQPKNLPLKFDDRLLKESLKRSHEVITKSIALIDFMSPAKFRDDCKKLSLYMRGASKEPVVAPPIEPCCIPPEPFTPNFDQPSNPPPSLNSRPSTPGNDSTFTLTHYSPRPAQAPSLPSRDSTPDVAQQYFMVFFEEGSVSPRPVLIEPPVVLERYASAIERNELVNTVHQTSRTVIRKPSWWRRIFICS